MKKINERCGKILALLCITLLATMATQAADRPLADTTITGKITSATGEALANVSVTVKGSTTGTATNTAGNFTITAPDDATLVLSSVGFETQEIPMPAQQSFNIALSSVSAALEQVVVIGYGTANKRDLTGSIATVKGKDIADRPSANPVSVTGKGRRPYIVNSGRPGAEPDVRIRGTNTINWRQTGIHRRRYPQRQYQLHQPRRHRIHRSPERPVVTRHLRGTRRQRRHRRYHQKSQSPDSCW